MHLAGDLRVVRRPLLVALSRHDGQSRMTLVLLVNMLLHADVAGRRGWLVSARICFHRSLLNLLELRIHLEEVGRRGIRDLVKQALLGALPQCLALLVVFGCFIGQREAGNNAAQG